MQTNAIVFVDPSTVYEVISLRTTSRRRQPDLKIRSLPVNYVTSIGSTKLNVQNAILI